MGSRLVMKLMAASLLMMPAIIRPGPADAALLLSSVAAFASPTVPGQVAPAELTFTNTSTDVAINDAMTVTDIRLVPGCGASDAGCSVLDPNVFQLKGPFLGLTDSTHSVCPDSYTVSVSNALTGEVRFTPVGPPPRMDPMGSCTISFSTITLKVPGVDASPTAGMQTAVNARVTGSATNGGQGSGFGSSLPTVNPAPQARFTPVTPARILDTRGGATPAPGTAFGLQVAGRGGVPADASAVVLNVTVVAYPGSPPGYVTLWPAGEPRPTVSNLNYRPGQVVPNLVTVGVGAGGNVSLYSEGWSVDILVDVAGYYGATAESAFNAVQPDRILDTRTGTGVATAATVGPGGVVNLQVTGRGGVPADATAVVLNVTAVGLSGAPSSYITAWPTGSVLPPTSNLNLVSGQVVPNLVVAEIGSGGRVSLRNEAGRVHLLADVAGYFGPTGARFSKVHPQRLLDTRTGTGAPAVTVPAGGTVELQVTGRAGVTPGATAVVMNVTAVGLSGSASSYVTAWPTGSPRPNASNLNLVAGQVSPNLVMVKVGTGGKVSLFNAAGNVHLLADVSGSFTP